MALSQDFQFLLLEVQSPAELLDLCEQDHEQAKVVFNPELSVYVWACALYSSTLFLQLWISLSLS